METPRVASIQSILPILAAAGLADIPLSSIRGIRFKMSRVHCIQCGCSIPSGRAGRKCEECRKVKDS